MSYLRPLALLVLGAVTLTGCATYSPDVYQAGQVQQVQSVELGTVEAVRSVQIQGKSNELYTLREHIGLVRRRLHRLAETVTKP